MPTWSLWPLWRVWREARRAGAATDGGCAACAHFRNDAGFLAGALPGVEALSSLAASVRADDGLCLRHQRYVGARGGCAGFARRADA